jgi:hypothetical protein
MADFITITTSCVFQNYDEIIKNYTEKSVAIFKTEPDLDYLIDRLQ